MKNSKALLAGIIGLGIAGGIIAWLLFGGSGPIDISLDKGVKAKFNATLRNTEISREKDGKPLWRFKVDEVTNDQTVGKAFLKGIKGRVYRADGSWLDLQSSAGEMVSQGHDFLLKDGVRCVYSTDGSRLEADTVHWQQERQLLTASGKVQIWKGLWYARGDEAISGGSFKKFKLKGHAYLERKKEK